MTLASNIFDLLDPQAIFILLAVIIAAIKAFFEQKKNDPPEESIGEETGFDPYQAYEEELARQRRDLKIEMPSPSTPPPLTGFSTAPPLTPAPVRPKLSEAEQRALSNLNLQTRRPTKRSKDSTRARVYRHLSSPTAAREALLLAEVLGPPKALQDDR